MRTTRDTAGDIIPAVSHVAPPSGIDCNKHDKHGVLLGMIV